MTTNPEDSKSAPGPFDNTPASFGGPHASRSSMATAVEGSTPLPKDNLEETPFTVTPSGINGGGHMKTNSVQFGDFAGGLGSSPMFAHVNTPQPSPSPVPQPAMSGGRPPTFQSQNNAPNFGQMGDDRMRNASSPFLGGQAVPLRRDPSQSSHSDVSSRGAYQGRGRGTYNNYQGQVQYSAQQNYGQQNRPIQNRYNRPQQFAGRSPAIMNANPAPMQMVPGIPGQQYGYPPYQQVNDPSPKRRGSPSRKGKGRGRGSHPKLEDHEPTFLLTPVPIPHDISPASGNFERFLTSKPQGFAQVQLYPDSSIQNVYAQNQWMPGQPPYAPPSPRPSYQGAPYGHNAAPSMSRSSSHMSVPDRPSSSMGQPATPNRDRRPSPAPKDFIIPDKRKKALVIKNDQGVVQAPPKPSPRATPSPVKAARSRSVSVAEDDDEKREEKRKEMKDAVALRIKEQQAPEPEPKPIETKAEPVKEEPIKEPVKEPVKEEPVKEEPVKEEPVKEAEPVKELKPAEPVKEDDEMEKMIKQMEEEEAAREKEEAEKEAVYKAKKDAEKATLKQKEDEEEARYYATLKEAEREAEAAEEAAQRKRDEGTSTPLSTDSPAAPTPDASGAATPVSDSMPPPRSARPIKPTGLVLETPKQVEPPQLTPAMKSLRDARPIEDFSSIKYPSSVNPPNPVLLKGTRAKLEGVFMRQFHDKYKEKPSLDWETVMRDTLGGDVESRVVSARTPQSMSGRTPSNRGNPMPFPGMGSFNAPPRTDRFPMAPMGRGAPPNPFQFGRPVGMPLGPAMSRNASSTGLGQIPASPRVGGSQRGGRAGSKRDTGSRKKHEDENKSMPLTSHMDLKPIQVSQSGWKAQSLRQGGGPQMDGHMPPDVVQRKVKALLNKMTPEKFEKIADQILAIAAQSKNETDGRTLRQVIQLTFEKATDEAHWAPTYALFCELMLKSMSTDIKDENIKDKAGSLVTGGALFRKYLLNRCQEEFERGWKVNMPPKPKGADEAALLTEEYYIAAAAKRRGLGLVKFIGELHKLGMLTERIMHQCIKKLLEMDDSGPDESEVESLVSLLNTVGYNLDQSERSHSYMNAYFERITQIMNHKDLPSRLKFKLLDVIDLRRHNWHSKNDDKGPKTITQIHDEAAKKQHEAEMDRIRQQASGRGGRMPMGRGDARNFSGRMPPPDYNSNNVGTDDLRRLGTRTGRNPSNPGGPTLGPSNLFSSGRTNSRRGLGPGSLLSRGEDSGNSSRTGTPPQKDKKEEGDKSSTNAFSALAALEGETSNQAASPPPSTTSSPPTTKSRPEPAKAE